MQGQRTGALLPRADDSKSAALAREICEGCPAKVECLAEALTQEGNAGRVNHFGIRGGTGPEEWWQLYQLGLAVAAVAESVLEPEPQLVRSKRQPAGCGTRVGYQKHLEEVCALCRYANTAADRRLRSTGSTREAAWLSSRTASNDRRFRL